MEGVGKAYQRWRRERTVAAEPPTLVTKVPTSPTAAVASLTILEAPSMSSVIWAEARRAGLRRMSCWAFILFLGMRLFVRKSKTWKMCT